MRRLIPIKSSLFFGTLLGVEVFNSTLLVGLAAGARNLQTALSDGDASPANILTGMMSLVLTPVMLIYGGVLTREELRKLRLSRSERTTADANQYARLDELATP